MKIIVDLLGSDYSSSSDFFECSESDEDFITPAKWVSKVARTFFDKLCPKEAVISLAQQGEIDITYDTPGRKLWITFDEDVLVYNVNLEPTIIIKWSHPVCVDKCVEQAEGVLGHFFK